MQMLAVEIYKALHNQSSSLMKDLFQTKNTKYDLCKGNTLISRNVKTVYYGTESISYLAPKIWELFPKEIKKGEKYPLITTTQHQNLHHLCRCFPRSIKIFTMLRSM